MNDPSPSAMSQLRESTRAEHDRAENHEFQRALVRGELPRGRYAAWLGQMYLIHLALETALSHAADDHDGLQTVVRDYQYQVPYIQQDLRFFQIDPGSIEPLPATRRFVSMVTEHNEDPLLLLGLHYVLEGSNNGSRYIARHVAKAFELAPGPGLLYLDPYGERQRVYWQAFKQDMDSLSFTPADTARLIEAAKLMYRTVAELSDDLTSTD